MLFSFCEAQRNKQFDFAAFVGISARVFYLEKDLVSGDIAPQIPSPMK